MLGRLNGYVGGKGLDDETLDELEGEALVVIDQPERYSHHTVEMARITLDMVRRLRRIDDGRGETTARLLAIPA